MGKPDGGSAFPSNGTMGEVVHLGMTLRDYFAAKAMQEYIRLNKFTVIPEEVAKQSYKVADAMVAEKNQ